MLSRCAFGDLVVHALSRNVITQPGELGTHWALPWPPVPSLPQNLMSFQAPKWSVRASWPIDPCIIGDRLSGSHEVLKKLRRHNRLLVGRQPVNETTHHVESRLFSLQLELGDLKSVTLLLLFARSALAGHRFLVLHCLLPTLALVEPARLVSLAINLPVLGDAVLHGLQRIERPDHFQESRRLVTKRSQTQAAGELERCHGLKQVICGEAGGLRTLAQHCRPTDQRFQRRSCLISIFQTPE